MNDLQKKELNLLKVFIEICDKIDVKYFLISGSALGTVKYGGFIPWDDDVDVAMYREDYEKFVKEATLLLPEYIFLQNYRTDVYAPHIYSKLRDSKTTYIENAVANIDMNHGIYIDIFPLDGYPRERGEQIKLEKLKQSYKRKVACVFQVKRSLKSYMLMQFYKLCGYSQKTNYLLSCYNKLITKYSIEGSEIICNHGSWKGKKDYMPKQYYGNGRWGEFAGERVRIPEKCEEYLTRLYGNWEGELSEKEQMGHHYYKICDVEHSYLEYVEKCSSGKIRVKNRL